MPLGDERVTTDALNFTYATKQELIEPHRYHDFILNEDQTLLLSMYGEKTQNVKGARTIEMWKSTANTKRATCAMIVTASGLLTMNVLISPEREFTMIKKCMDQMMLN